MHRPDVEPHVTDLPGERAERWVKTHQRHAATSTFVYEFVWDVTKPAIGPFCTDVDGNVLLDFASHVASSPLGYNHPRIIERLEAVGAIDPLKIAGQDFYASLDWPPDDSALPGPTQLLRRLVESTDHYDMDTVFLSNSGAEAVENAIKICYDHVGGKYGVTFHGAFHGRTLGALSLNRSKAVHRHRFPEISGIESVPFCDDRHCEPATCSCGFLGPAFDEDADPWNRSQLDRLVHPTRGPINPSDVSYIILEPIQGEGGYRMPSDAFVSAISDIVEAYDIPLIVDEIQTGLGRTGEMWGSDHYPIEPDVIACGKALRVGATIGRAEMFPDRPGRISSTWGGGDLLGALQGAVIMDTIIEENLLENVRRRGEQCLELLRSDPPDFVKDIRGKGLMLAVDFDSKERRDAVVRASFLRGLLTLGCGYRTLRILPPLDVTEREIRIGVSLLHDAFTDETVRSAAPSVTGADDVI